MHLLLVRNIHFGLSDPIQYKPNRHPLVLRTAFFLREPFSSFKTGLSPCAQNSKSRTPAFSTHSTKRPSKNQGTKNQGKTRGRNGEKPGQPESLSERKYLMGDSPSSAGPAQKAFSCGEHRGDILRAANWPYPAVTGFQLGVSAIR